MNYYMLSVLVFVIALLIILYKDRKNIKRESVLLLRKTKKGKKLLIKTGTSFPRFWKTVGFISVVTCFFASVWMLYSLILQTQMLLAGKAELGPGILIPSVTQETVIGPGYFAVPFWYWIISIFVLVVVHEGFHGIMAAREKLRIKSLGWGLFFVIPLAFVELDEKRLRKEKPWKQLRIFSAGSFANFITAFVVFVIAVYSINNLFTPIGIGYKSLIKGYPAEQVNLTGIITGIDNYTIKNINDLNHALKQIGPDKKITIYTKTFNKTWRTKTFTLVTVQSPHTNESKGFIGISDVYNFLELKPENKAYSGVIYFLFGRPGISLGLFDWLFLINLFVGLFNLLPLGPLDGGRMWEIVFKKITPKHFKKIMNTLSALVLLIIVLDFALVLV